MSGPAVFKSRTVRTKGEGSVGRTVNAAGVFGALLLMVIALTRSDSVAGESAAYPLTASGLADDLRAGTPVALGMAACLLLVLTPVVRMGILAVYLAIQRRYAFSAAAAVVVAILAAAYAAG